MDHAATANENVDGHAAGGHDDGTQQHPLGVYFKIWGLLFVLSLLSYLVDYFAFQGLLRWSLILIFMFLKAGLIIAVFMHMVWERLALIYAILLPPLCLIVLVGLMSLESDYTHWTRILFMEAPVEALPVEHHKDPGGDHH